MALTILQLAQEFAAARNLPIPTTLVLSSLADDPATAQILSLIYATGRELRQARDWIQLKKTATLTTVDGTATYAIPSDWYSFLYDTGWNSTTKLPLLGPVPDYFLNYELYGAAPTGALTQYRIFGLPGTNQITIFPTPSSVETLNYDYLTKNWIGTGSAPYTWSEAIVNDADIMAFDDELMILGLTWKWYQAKGLDYVALAEEQKSKLDQAMNRFKGSYTGSLSRYPRYGFNQRFRPGTPGGWVY